MKKLLITIIFVASFINIEMKPSDNLFNDSYLKDHHKNKVNDIILKHSNPEINKKCAFHSAVKDQNKIIRKLNSFFLKNSLDPKTFLYGKELKVYKNRIKSIQLDQAVYSAKERQLYELQQKQNLSDGEQIIFNGLKYDHDKKTKQITLSKLKRQHNHVGNDNEEKEKLENKILETKDIINKKTLKRSKQLNFNPDTTLKYQPRKKTIETWKQEQQEQQEQQIKKVKK
jgi:hypothetical protein